MRSTTLRLRPPDRTTKRQPKGAWDELSRALFRYRVEFFPILLAFWLYVITAVMGPRLPWVVPGTLALGAILTYQFGGRWNLPRFHLARRERAYAAAVMACLGTWAWFAVALSESAKPSLRWTLILLGMCVPLSIPWLWHRRIQGSVLVTFEPMRSGASRRESRDWNRWHREMTHRAREVVASWDGMIHGTSALGSKLVAIHFDAWSVECSVRLAHARVAEDFTELRLRRLESAFMAKRDSARTDYATGKGASARDAKIKFMFQDPHAEPIIPTDDDLTPDMDLTVDIGRFENNIHVIIDLIHTLVAGASGAGKSAIINAIMRGLIRKPHVAIVGIDLKPGGLELGKWEEAMYALATTGPQAKTLLTGILNGIGRRGEIMKARGIRKWVATEAEPFVVLIIDEVQALKEFRLFATLTKISELSRAYGFAMIVATQHPKDSSVPTGAIANCTQRIGLQCNASTAERLIFDDNATREGWRLTKLPGDREGTFLVKSKRHRRPMRARCHWLDDHHVEREARSFAATTTAIDPGTWGDDLLAIDPPDEGTEIIDVQVIVENGPEDVIMTLIGSGRARTPSKISELSQIPVRTVNVLLKKLASEGKVIQDGARKPWSLT